MPISLQARMTLTAISPRFAINTLENTLYLLLMSFTRAKAALSGTRFADLRWVEETDSTNTDAQRVLLDSAGSDPRADTDVVVVADHQRAGRGRLGRSWEAPSGASLLMSLGTNAELQDAHRGLLLTAVSVAAVRAIDSQLDVGLRIKWPNDLVAAHGGPPPTVRKVAGVLAEATPLPDGRTGYVVGIGINCNWVRISGALADIATSLDVLSGGAVDREDLAVGIIEGFAERLDLLEQAGASSGSDRIESLLNEARADSATLGSEVVVASSHGEIRGRAVDLDHDGALLVDPGDGSGPQRVVVGDVVSLRPS